MNETNPREAVCVAGSRAREAALSKFFGTQMTPSQVPNTRHGISGFGFCLDGFWFCFALIFFFFYPQFLPFGIEILLYAIVCWKRDLYHYYCC